MRPNQFVNLIGENSDVVDEQIRSELTTAAIDVVEGVRSPYSVIRFSLTGRLGPWVFSRQKDFWLAEASHGFGFSEDTARQINDYWGGQIHIKNNLLGGVFIDWNVSDGCTFDAYHVDTPEALKLFAAMAYVNSNLKK